MDTQPNPDYATAPNEGIYLFWNSLELRPPYIEGIDWKNEPDGWHECIIVNGKVVEHEFRGLEAP